MRHGTMIQWGDGKTIEDPAGHRGQTDLEFVVE
jgi:hypothetical protein